MRRPTNSSLACDSDAGRVKNTQANTKSATRGNLTLSVFVLAIGSRELNPVEFRAGHLRSPENARGNQFHQDCNWPHLIFGKTFGHPLDGLVGRGATVGQGTDGIWGTGWRLWLLTDASKGVHFLRRISIRRLAGTSPCISERQPRVHSRMQHPLSSQSNDQDTRPRRDSTRATCTAVHSVYPRAAD